MRKDKSKKTTNTSIRVYLNKSKITKDGTSNINIELSASINSVQVKKRIFTGYNVKHEVWDNENARIKTNIRGAESANHQINSIVNKLRSIKLDLEYKGEDSTPEAILDIYNNSGKNNDKYDFLAFTESELKQTSKDYSDSYYNDMNNNLAILKEFTKNKLLFEDITPLFLDRFRYYLEHTKKNKINSIYQKINFIRKFVNKAIVHGLTQNYPFKDYKLKSEKVDKEYLELKEVHALHELYLNDKTPLRIKTTLHYFLLSCYTGLRLSDIKRVDKGCIINNTIVMKTQKTGTIVKIPISEATLSLLDFDLEGLKLFEKTIKQSKSRITKDLNDALEMIKLKSKKITFHCSRHSFAINSLILGIPIEVVSKILGHADLTTTQIYAKVVDELKNSEMEKWNKISVPKKKTIELE